MSPELAVQLSDHRVPDAQRAEILANPGFGKHFTDHMVRIDWTKGRGWDSGVLQPYQPLTMDPASMALHYGQLIFEGLKGYEQPDGSVATFRPYANAERFGRSARRLAMPELPAEQFVESLKALVEVDRAWVPNDGGDAALYLRPFMISTEVGLGVKPSSTYAYMLIASPAGAYFPGGVEPVSVWLSTEYVRAAPGGTGEAKCAGNYAASLIAQAQAADEGCDQVVWLDATERRWVEEMGGMNLYFVYGSGPSARIVTPALTGSLLAGVTRDSLLTLARDLGYTAEEDKISTDGWRHDAESGALTEVFACGTAAVITPVGTVKSADGQFTMGDGTPGPVAMQLRESLLNIQTGKAPDPHNWRYELVGPRG